MAEKTAIPASLPENPEGWTKRMTLHLNFGMDGGAAIYRVCDAQGNDTGIVYQYDTRKPEPARPANGKRKARPAVEPAKTGFHVPAAKSEVFGSWKELRAAWPEIVKATGIQHDHQP